MSTTLDSHHKKAIASFAEKYKSIEDKMKEIEPNDVSYVELQKERKQTEGDEKQYYMKVMDLLLLYYGKDQISDNPSQKKLLNKLSASNKKKQRTKPFFNKYGGLKQFINTTNKAQLFQEYKYRLYEDISKKEINYSDEPSDLCKNCNMQQTLDTSKSIYVCEGCGVCNFVLVEPEKTPYIKNPLIETNTFSYRRYDHFVEWLNKFQNHDKCKIPMNICNLVQKELKRCKDTWLHDTTHGNITFLQQHEMILQILKQTGNTKYNSHVIQIMNKINNKKTPMLPAKIQHEMKNMFKQTQQPFAEICPASRTNFLSYSYVIRKFLEILDQPQYMRYFPLLKSKEKLHQQDLIWKAICMKLGWTYKPSV